MAIFNSYFDITRGYRNHISLAYPFLLRKDRIFGCRSPMVFCLPGPSLRWFSLKKHVFLWLKMKVNQPKNKKSHHQNLGGPSFLSYTPFQPFNDVVICCVSAPFLAQVCLASDQALRSTCAGAVGSTSEVSATFFRLEKTRAFHLAGCRSQGAEISDRDPGDLVTKPMFHVPHPQMKVSKTHQRYPSTNAGVKMCKMWIPPNHPINIQ